MLELPMCDWCKHEREDGTCPAYPKGIPGDVLFNKKDNMDKECGNGVKFEKDEE